MILGHAPTKVPHERLHGLQPATSHRYLRKGLLRLFKGCGAVNWTYKSATINPSTCEISSAIGHGYQNDINCIRNHSILPDPAYSFQCLQLKFASPQRHSCGFFRLAVVLVAFRFNHRIGEPVSGVPYLNSKGAMAERYWKMLRVGLLSMADKNWASTCLNKV